MGKQATDNWQGLAPTRLMGSHYSTARLPAPHPRSSSSCQLGGLCFHGGPVNECCSWVLNTSQINSKLSLTVSREILHHRVAGKNESSEQASTSNSVSFLSHKRKRSSQISPKCSQIECSIFFLGRHNYVCRNKTLTLWYSRCSLSNLN